MRTKFAICSVTGEKMFEGWVTGDGEDYFKYEKDALAYAKERGYKDIDEILFVFKAQVSQTQIDIDELLEIHFEVVSYIKDYYDDNSKISNVELMQGIGGLYELAADLSKEFYNHIQSLSDDGEGLKDGEFYDMLDEFLDNKLK